MSAKLHSYPHLVLHLALRLPLLLLLLVGQGVAAQNARFEILKGNTVVGSVSAMRTGGSERTTYLMTSYSEVDLVWKRVIRTDLVTEYEGGELSSCRTTVKVNNAMRDSSMMARGADDCYVHPAQNFSCVPATHWTTARMYFEEPLDQTTVFVESVLRECPLERTGNGTYKLTFPDRSVNHYAYKDGVLQEIRVDRSLFELVFRRS